MQQIKINSSPYSIPYKNQTSLYMKKKKKKFPAIIQRNNNYNEAWDYIFAAETALSHRHAGNGGVSTNAYVPLYWRARFLFLCTLYTLEARKAATLSYLPFIFSPSSLTQYLLHQTILTRNDLYFYVHIYIFFFFNYGRLPSYQYVLDNLIRKINLVNYVVQ